MTYMIAKRSENPDTYDYHLWREGPKIVEFGSEDSALSYMAELAQRFGMDSLMLVRRVEVRFQLEVTE